MKGRIPFGSLLVACVLALPLPLYSQDTKVANVQTPAALKLKSRTIRTEVPIRCFALSADNKRLLVGSSKVYSPGREILDWKEIKVWNLAQDKETQTLIGHTLPPRYLAFSRDNKKAVAVTEFYGDPKGPRKSDVLIWDLTTGKLIKKFEVDGIARQLLPAGDFLVTAQYTSGTVRVYDINNDCKVIFSKDIKQLDTGAVSPDGSVVATTKNEPATLQMWRVPTGKEEASFQLSERDAKIRGAEFEFENMFFSGDGKTLCGQGWTTYCWNVPQKQWLYRLDFRGHAISADGHYLVGQGANGKRMLMSLKSGKRVAELEYDDPQWQPHCYAIASDSSFVILAGSGGIIRIWDLPKDLPE